VQRTGEGYFPSYQRACSHAGIYSWAQISKAMNGKRTPRQVASRVQKYFEKLKRYGLDVASSSNRNDG
jgi:hypothetical protein